LQVDGLLVLGGGELRLLSSAEAPLAGGCCTGWKRLHVLLVVLFQARGHFQPQRVHHYYPEYYMTGG
jgi:hypothetical protein